MILALVATAAVSSVRGADWIVLPKNPTTQGDVVAGSYAVNGAAINDSRLLDPTDPKSPLIYSIGAWQRGGNRFTLLDSGNAPVAMATDISRADGKTIVGYVTRTAGAQFSFYWNAEDGLTELTAPGTGGESQTLACSADGRVLVGTGSVSGVQAHPFRFEVGKGWNDLGTFGGGSGRATDVSDDGDTICGQAQDAQANDQAFFWTKKTGKVPISLGGAQSFADAISANGEFVIGEGDLSGGRSAAYRYDVKRRKASRLPDLSRFGGSDATLISKDGGVVVGTSIDQFFNTHAFRWSAKGGMKDIGSLGLTAVPNSDSFPICISGKGDYVGGWAQNPTYSGLGVDEREAFVWSTKHSMLYVHAALEAAFDRQLPKWRFYELQAMSQDGRRWLIDALNPEDEEVLLYVQLPRARAYVKGRGNANVANLAAYGAAIYGYYAYVWEPTTTSYNAFLYSYYAYLYDQQARKHIVDYYNKEKVADAYAADRRAAYQAAYGAYVNAAARAGSGEPFAYETAYYASLAYSYMLADLKSL
jgi:probable HAF family extracellular repeat protein